MHQNVPLFENMVVAGIIKVEMRSYWHGLSWWLSGKESMCNAEATEKRVQSLNQEDPLEKEMATQSSIFAQKIPWTEEPGRIQPIGWQGVGHD